MHATADTVRQVGGAERPATLPEIAVEVEWILRERGPMEVPALVEALIEAGVELGVDPEEAVLDAIAEQGVLHNGVDAVGDALRGYDPVVSVEGQHLRVVGGGSITSTTCSGATGCNRLGCRR